MRITNSYNYMQKLTTSSVVTILGLIIVVVAGFALWWNGALLNVGSSMRSQSAAAAAANLLTTGNFAILAGSGIMNTGSTTVTGDVGSYATLTQTGFGPGANSVTITGTNHFGDGTTQTAKTDLVTAYNALANQTPDHTISADLGGQTLTPGVYNSGSTIGITGTTTLDGGGDPDAVFVFQAGSAITTASGSHVVLTGGTQACNVFWQIGSDATLGTGSTFRGTLIALSSITVTTGVTVDGRVLARNGAVTLDTNSIIVPACTTPAPATLHVIKHVINDNVGTSTANAWTLAVTSSNSGTGVGSAVGAESPGSAYTLQAGKAYSVAESGGPSGYNASSSTDCTIASVVSGATYTCTITNDDIVPAPATLHVIKSVVSVTGTATPPDFLVHVKSATSTLDVAGSPLAGTSSPGTLYTLPAGTYQITENVNPSFPTYHQTFGLDCVGGSVTLIAGQDQICTIINTDIPVPAPAANGGGSFAPLPLIAVTKVPTPLSLPAGPGVVTYIYTVTNIGPVPMIGVWVKDDKCSPATYISGDTNNDTKLDIGEAWIYRCMQTVSETVTNTATAHGQASGWDAYDTALATVVVGAPVAPPLIAVTKVPSRLTPFPFGGGDVTYTYTVTNPGVVALHDTVVTDDKCATVSRVSGDSNGDNLLDPGEVWTYTCQTHISVSTRNTATAKGTANGLIAIDYAFATVLVAVPGLPKTGFPPEYDSQTK